MRREKRLLWVVLLAGWCCRAPTPASLPIEGADCPASPPELPSLEELRQLSRQARETRANLMVSLGDGWFATLHPPELALTEATLVEPLRARQQDAAWLREHLFMATLELHTPQPLLSFEGDLREVTIMAEGGRALPAIGVSSRSDSQGWTYRFLLDPRLFQNSKDLRLRFSMRGDNQHLRASWSLSRRVLDKLDDQPVVFQLARLRQLRWARWLAISGLQTAARGIVDGLLACAPELAEAGRLKSALTAPLPAALPAELLRLPARSPALAVDPSQVPERELVLRAELLRKLGESFSRGLLRPQGLSAAQQQLKLALNALGRPRNADLELSRALLTFDRQLAQLLAEGLDVTTMPSRAQPIRELRVLDGPLLPPVEIEAELGRRLALAGSGLLPQWIPAQAGTQQLREMRPLLEAEVDGERRFAVAHTRLGPGWLHPGLPKLRFKVSLRDHGAEYWADEVGQARELHQLQEVAARLLEHELAGPDEASAELAMNRIGVPVVAKRLSSMRRWEPGEIERRLRLLLDSAQPSRAAKALRALSHVSHGQDVLVVLRKAARSPHAELRAAAVETLAGLGQAEDLVAVRQGLRDSATAVEKAAALALLRLRDPEAVRLARAWLASDDQRRQWLLEAAAAAGLPQLGQDFLRLLRGPATPKGVAAALAHSLGDAAVAPLTRLYAKVGAELRQEILTQARGPAYRQLLLRAVRDQDVPVRCQALARLAELAEPPLAPYVEAAAAPDARLRLMGDLGLARQRGAAALLRLAAVARGSCAERLAVIRPVAAALDEAGRLRLLGEALRSPCAGLPELAWKILAEYRTSDLTLLQAGLSHRDRKLRVRAALWILEL